MSQPSSPKPTVTHYPSGQGIGITCPGDFILTHRKEVYSWAVSHGQRLRFRRERRPYAHWSHAALVVGYQGEIVEALGRGVTFHDLSIYQNTEYHYVQTGMESRDREQAATFAKACLGEGYGWATIASLALIALTGSHLQFGLNGTEICSGLVARALERGPFIFPNAPNTMMPADLAEYFDVKP